MFVCMSARTREIITVCVCVFRALKTYPIDPSYKQILVGRYTINIFCKFQRLKQISLLINFKIDDLCYSQQVLGNLVYSR